MSHSIKDYLRALVERNMAPDSSTSVQVAGTPAALTQQSTGQPEWPRMLLSAWLLLCVGVRGARGDCCCGRTQGRDRCRVDRWVDDCEQRLLLGRREGGVSLITRAGARSVTCKNENWVTGL